MKSKHMSPNVSVIGFPGYSHRGCASTGSSAIDEERCTKSKTIKRTSCNFNIVNKSTVQQTCMRIILLLADQNIKSFVQSIAKIFRVPTFFYPVIFPDISLISKIFPVFFLVFTKTF